MATLENENNKRPREEDVEETEDDRPSKLSKSTSAASTFDEAVSAAEDATGAASTNDEDPPLDENDDDTKKPASDPPPETKETDDTAAKDVDNKGSDCGTDANDPGEKKEGKEKIEGRTTPDTTENTVEDDADMNHDTAVGTAIIVDRTGTENPSTENGPADNPPSQPEEEAAAPGSTVEPASSQLPAVSEPVDPNQTATVTNPEQIIEERGEVSAMYIGRVIGKGGEMIRDLQARSGARMDVDQNVPTGQPRVITYRGTRRTVDAAKQLVAMLCQEGVSEESLPLGEAKRELLVIPAQTVGKVIGRGGEMIRELQGRSQARIQIDHSGASGVPPDQKQVTITGTETAVVKAKEMVMFLTANPMMDSMQSLNILVDEKLRGGKWGSGPPYPNLPNQGVNMQPQMPGGYGGGYGGEYGGGFLGYQQPPAGYVPAASYPPAQPTFNQYGGGASGGFGQEMDVVYAAKGYMGRIIGQKGATVNDLQRRSGCEIQINQDVQPGQDCEISIRGPRQGIEVAKQMIREIIEAGPSHPYAGGSQGGGGGPYGNGGGGGYQQQGFDYPQQQQQYGYQQGYVPQGYDPNAPAYGQQYGGPPQQYGGGSGYGQPMPQQYGAGYAQPRAAPAQPAPSVWKSATSPDGQVYYYNEVTGETRWDKPASMP